MLWGMCSTHDDVFSDGSWHFKLKAMEIPTNIIAKMVDADMVLLNLTDGTYYKLNTTGAFLWKELQKGVTPNQVALSLAERYTISAETARGDIDALLKDLHKEGLLKTETD